MSKTISRSSSERQRDTFSVIRFQSRAGTGRLCAFSSWWERRGLTSEVPQTVEMVVMIERALAQGVSWRKARNTNVIAGEYIMGDTCGAPPRRVAGAETSGLGHARPLDADRIYRCPHLRSCLQCLVAVASFTMGCQRWPDYKLVRRLTRRNFSTISQNRTSQIWIFYR